MKKLFLNTSICIFLLFSFNLNAQMAFFYQTVGPFVSGVGYNTVEIGTTYDGINITTNNVSALDFYIGSGFDTTIGDPVFSYLPTSGNWTFTGWAAQDDYRGSGRILYHESPCPLVIDSDIIDLGADTAVGCQVLSSIQIGKTSQVFEENGRTYVVHSIPQIGVHIACLSDGINLAMNLTALCVKPTAYASLASLNYGETMPIFDVDSLRLSDVAIAKRVDGTWVLFMKGASDTSTCIGGSLCELAARGIYRTTSTDFLSWTALEKVVSKASVPEASTAADGKVWLYWQDFTNAVAANNLVLASIAPISGAYETPSTYVLSTPIQTYFNGEPFQTNSSLHYATNGNPIHLPNPAAISDLQSCIIANGGIWTGISDNRSIDSFLNIYPNPFSSTTTLSVRTPSEQTSENFKDATLTIYNVYGQTVKQITPITIGAGQTITLYRDNLSSKMYFIRLTTPSPSGEGWGEVIAVAKLVITD